ncbi:MAG: cysS [Candidatus Parcubacteria bacterium]|nr:cysS [Candidatus Parcubacteria bacterium]
MDIHIFNTLTRQKEAFKPLKAGEMSMYQCGPTVYDTPHIGNYRTFVMDDVVRRVFEYNAYRVTQVMNATDVDDKTIKRSKQEGVTLQALTRKYEQMFLEELESLNILLPHHFIRATDYIQAMIDLVSALLEKGAAYAAEDGIYLSISKVKDYGALAHLNIKDPSKERVANDEYDKEDPRDFAVWKFRSAEDGDVSWDAPFGAGRPGWHIECSAMAMSVLGTTLDIHTGGTDLIFPHHTNEIAQSEAATGKQFVRYWIHGGFMNVSDEKMAKSKGNFIKLGDMIEESVSPLAYRYWLLTSHYRSQVNFTYEAVRSAQNALIRLMKEIGRYPAGGAVISAYKERFNAYINDDLNTPQAIALVWELLKDAAQSDADKKATLLDFDAVFGLKLASVPPFEEEPVPPEVQALADAREEARKAKDWTQADALRKEIEERGFELNDTPDGVKIRGRF